MMQPSEPAPPDQPALRLRRANRQQVVPVPAYLDALLPEDHLARLLWQAVEQLDLSAFSAGLVVREGGPGRAAADPQVLVALWLYATTQGVTSVRALARLCVEHLAYIWLCGGVSVNYHSLSDFRVDHAAALDDLMTQVLGHLYHAGLLALEQVAQDGVRVRASAGTGSFRRQPTRGRGSRRCPTRRRSSTGSTRCWPSMASGTCACRSARPSRSWPRCGRAGCRSS
jgi:transposase